VGPERKVAEYLEKKGISSLDASLKTTLLLLMVHHLYPAQDAGGHRAHPDAFMYAINVCPNSIIRFEDVAPCSGQRASFRTIEKIDDHGCNYTCLQICICFLLDGARSLFFFATGGTNRMDPAIVCYEVW
jgi:hypothetical protein